MNEKKSKESLRNNIIEDLAVSSLEIIGSIATGIPLQIPTATLKFLGKKFHKTLSYSLSPDHWNWEEIYNVKLEECISIPLVGRKEIIIPHTILYENIDNSLSMKDIILRNNREIYQINPDVDFFWSNRFEEVWDIMRKKRKIENRPNIRLKGINRTQKHLYLDTQVAYYKDFVQTNLSLDIKINEKTLRQMVNYGGHIEEIHKSRLCNLIGIEVIMLTSKGELILQKRSKSVAFRNSEICNAASGTMSRFDISAEKQSLNNIPTLRELSEEIGVEIEDIKEGTFRFLGITRDLMRGGNPELIFYAETLLPWDKLSQKWENAPDRWESSNLLSSELGELSIKDNLELDEYSDLIYRITRLFNQNEYSLSVDFQASIGMWLRMKKRSVRNQ